jgi:hypothetical protein
MTRAQKHMVMLVGQHAARRTNDKCQEDNATGGMSEARRNVGTWMGLRVSEPVTYSFVVRVVEGLRRQQVQVEALCGEA